MKSADFNGDGIGDPGFPASTCAVDNCPSVANPGQSDPVPGARFPFPLYDVGRISDVMVIDDFNGDGVPDAAVASRWDTNVTLLLGLGDGRLQPGSPVSAGDEPVTLSAGDFNGDGHDDLVVGTSHGTVSVLLGDGHGGLSQGSFFDVGYGGALVGAGRLDADHKLDLAVTDYYSQELLIYGGNGNGTFSLRQTFALTSAPGRPLVTDLTGDGLDDVVLMTGNRLRIFVSSAGGGLSETNFDAGMSGNLAARDLDGDGRIDLMVRGTYTFGVFLQTSPLAFHALPQVSAYAYDYWFLLDDFDSDGRADLLLGDMTLWHGNGDGTFAPPGPPLFSSRITMAAVADLDTDERPDLVLTLGESQITTARNAGRGTFVVPQIVAGLNVLPSDAVLADLDEDGINDLVWNRVDVFWARGRPGGKFGPPTAIGVPDGAFAFSVVDLDRDGHLDIVATTYRDTGVVLLGRGDGTFVTKGSFGTGHIPVAVVPGDLNHDGRIDLVVGNQGDYYNPQSSSLSVLLGNGDGTFAPERRYATTGVRSAPVLGDFNEDGRVDVAVGNYDVGTVSLFAGAGDGSLTPLPAVQVGLRPQAMTAVDLDGDGHLDLAVAIHNPDVNVPAPRGELVLLPGRGDGSFGTPVRRVLGDRPSDVVSVDFDFDGRPDLAVAYNGDSTYEYGALTVLLNRGNFDFTPERYGAGNPTSLVAGDADGDSRPDIVVLNAFDSVVVYHNTGLFPNRAPHATIAAPGVVECTGFDGASVHFDGSGSTDPDSTPGTNDDIASFDWFENYGLATQRSLGSGATLSVTLSLGTHAITLKVTDKSGASSTAATTITVVDTKAPMLTCPSTSAASECTDPGGAPLSLVATASDSCGGAVTITNDHNAGGADASGTYPLGSTSVTFRAVDARGNAATCSVPVQVVDTTPPILNCPSGIPAVECEGADQAQVVLSATAHDICSGVTITNDHTASGSDASGSYPLGTTNVGFTATDASGNPATCKSFVTVRDTIPPTLTLHADPTTLWPPDHELIPVNVSWESSDLCDGTATVQLVSATSSEPDDAVGNDDGATTGDIQGADIGTPDTALFLRAERDGKGPGRVYQLMYQAVDASGNKAPAFAVVTVPHDQGSGPEPLLMRLQPDGTPGMVRIYWSGIPGALGYDVISGDLSQAKVENGNLSLGEVRVLARGTTETALTEDSNSVMSATGTAIFYLIQSRTDRGGGGYGTESAPWPRVPASCEGGCP